MKKSGAYWGKTEKEIKALAKKYNGVFYKVAFDLGLEPDVFYQKIKRQKDLRRYFWSLQETPIKKERIKKSGRIIESGFIIAPMKEEISGFEMITNLKQKGELVQINGSYWTKDRKPVNILDFLGIERDYA
jgi:hypothetical protein